MNKHPPNVNISISLADIYSQLCPNCRESFLALLAMRAQGSVVLDALRSAFETPAQPEPAEPSPHDD